MYVGVVCKADHIDDDYYRCLWLGTVKENKYLDLIPSVSGWSTSTILCKSFVPATDQVHPFPKYRTSAYNSGTLGMGLGMRLVHV